MPGRDSLGDLLSHENPALVLGPVVILGHVFWGVGGNGVQRVLRGGDRPPALWVQVVEIRPALIPPTSPQDCIAWLCNQLTSPIHSPKITPVICD